LAQGPGLSAGDRRLRGAHFDFGPGRGRAGKALQRDSVLLLPGDRSAPRLFAPSAERRQSSATGSASASITVARWFPEPDTDAGTFTMKLILNILRPLWLFIFKLYAIRGNVVVGRNLHIGVGSKIAPPRQMRIGNDVYV